MAPWSPPVEGVLTKTRIEVLAHWGSWQVARWSASGITEPPADFFQISARCEQSFGRPTASVRPGRKNCRGCRRGECQEALPRSVQGLLPWKFEALRSPDYIRPALLRSQAVRHDRSFRLAWVEVNPAPRKRTAPCSRAASRAKIGGVLHSLLPRRGRVRNRRQGVSRRSRSALR